LENSGQILAARPGAAGSELRRDAGMICLVGVLALALLMFSLWPALASLRHSEAVFTASTHSITEMFAIVVATLIFAVSWNSYSRERPGNVIILACGFLAVGLLDLAHMLSYKDMPDFVTPAAPQKAIVFWLCARYVAALTLICVASRPWVPLPRERARYLYLLLALGASALAYVLQLYFPDAWPRLFIAGRGLTPTKVVAEYGVIVLLAVALLLFFRARARIPGSAELVTATAITMLSELCFTLYANVNDIFSLLGHLYKVLAYGLIYKAVFVSSVREPFLRLTAAVEQRQAAEQRIQFLAYHDPLTELPNRLMVRDSYRHAQAQVAASGARVALVFIDLDNFKQINDSLGHLHGDLVLREVAKRLQGAVQPADTVSRLGGDEFLLLVTGLPGAAALLPLIDALMPRLRAPIHIDGQELATSVSIGVAMYPDDGSDFDTLLQKADMAMYRAKDAGRNTYRFFAAAMLADAVERMSLRNGLVQALDRGEFFLHYQPQIDLASGAVIGVEALIRWQRPGHGPVPPARFIPIAEECGLIVPIGEWVLRTACRQMAAWRREGFEQMVVAVNLSALQFAHGDLEHTVGAALAQAGLPAHCLELELTESILIQDTEHELTKVQG
jgi:diguanylate cyclase (GGDEF)-like protein